MKKFLYLFVLITISCFAQVDNKQVKGNVDCLILEDENSIVCKYSHERIDVDNKIQVVWVDPDGEISRERTLTIPAGHGSIYDFRYISGRKKGIWIFKVINDNTEIKTTFEIK